MQFNLNLKNIQNFHVKNPVKILQSTKVVQNFIKNYLNSQLRVKMLFCTIILLSPTKVKFGKF